MAKAKGTLKPTYPRNTAGGCNTIPGFCKRGFKPLPSEGKKESRRKGLVTKMSRIRKKREIAIIIADT